jgi:mannose-6-phosphate isomerase-like protein (cupin superfamily)
MTKSVRRVVTGHDSEGRAVVAIDGPTPAIFTNPLRPGYQWSQVWMTDASPAPIDNGSDPTNRPVKIEPEGCGSVIRVIEFPPETAAALAKAREQSREVFARMGSAEAATGHGRSRHPLMHRTRTVDYGIVLEGSITMVLDDSEVELSAGDVVVQRGTNHAWSNRSEKPCRMVFVLLDGVQTPEMREAIERFDRKEDHE